jgi:hypothetical protein
VEYTKKLAVFTPCTHKEYLNGIQDDTITKYLEKIPSSKYSFDFIFTYNRFKDEDEYQDLKIYEDHGNINSVKIFNLDIPLELDIYRDIYKGAQKPNPLPPLGGSSGPNRSFYNSLELLQEQDYEYFLMLENDSFPCRDFWFDIFLDYCENNDFSIAGSKYKGHQKWHYVLDYKDHMNGIALYENSEGLKNILQESKKFHKEQISEEEWFLNFDIAIDRFRKTEKGQELIKGKNKFIDTPLITNLSDALDNYIKRDDIILDYPETTIVHQKTFKNKNFQPDGEFVDFKIDKVSPIHTEHDKEASASFRFRPGRVPIFLHNPRCGGTYIMSWNQILFNTYLNIKKYPLLKLGDDINLKSRRIIAEMDNGKELHIFCYSHKDLHLTDESFSDNKISYREGAQSIFTGKSSKKFRSKEDPYINRIHIDKLMPLINNDNFEIFSIIIPATGDIIDQRLPLLKCQEICKRCNASPHFYTSMREPFDKLESIHKQQMKENSSEETFMNFIKSNELPDSWLIRALTGIKSNQEVEKPHYEQAQKQLESFSVKDVKQLEGLVNEVFGYCLDLNTSMCKNRPQPQSINSSIGDFFIMEYELKDSAWEHNEKISLLDLVNARLFYERKIYERLIEGVN